MMEKFNRYAFIVFNTYQLYRTDTLTGLKEANARAAKTGYKLGAKLVRGAVGRTHGQALMSC